MTKLDLIINSFGIGFILFCLPIIGCLTVVLFYFVSVKAKIKDGIYAALIAIFINTVSIIIMFEKFSDLSSMINTNTDTVLSINIAIGTWIFCYLMFLLYDKICDIKEKKQKIKS